MIFSVDFIGQEIDHIWLINCLFISWERVAESCCFWYQIKARYVAYQNIDRSYVIDFLPSRRQRVKNNKIYTKPLKINFHQNFVIIYSKYELVNIGFWFYKVFPQLVNLGFCFISCSKIIYFSDFLMV